LLAAAAAAAGGMFFEKKSFGCGRNLSNIGLQGPVPAAISNLTSLQSLDISNIPGKEVQLNAVTGDLSALAPLQPNLQEL